ncbi:MAG TPA: chromate efflux transporter [Methylophilus sp.]|uniref:chromate efflux transporter n=1 Tax=Methylophilus sp. TaxID=29541 RepID=UPI002BC10047|nr:chromate efflux transporter [Methylophilus sp.]HSH88145.1 chromate efflux transporter [Methylophilus sp.]
MSLSTETDSPPKAVSLAEASLYWFKLGCISFGGPAGQIALMHHDLVEQKRWISESRFLHALNYCMILPGPEAQQLATYIGWLMHRTAGGLIAGILFFLPSFFMLVALGWVYMAYGSVPAVAGIFHGIKPAVIAIVLFAAYRIGSKALKNPLLWSIAILAFIGIFVFKLPFPLIVLFAALAGVAGGYYLPHYFQQVSGHAVDYQTHYPALIDDATPTPAHAIFSWQRFRHVISWGISLWATAMLILVGLYGWQGAFTQMGWFFTKAALFTFGGAYAVLPYVYQGAVEHYQWLTADQMMDALALGETTPGPLIMVVTFVAYVSGWNTEVLGVGHAGLSGFVAATIVTFFTFLPSLIFIFLGGPLIETTHGNLKFTAPLTAVTAAVVGVIFNLALFFAWHIYWPQGLANGIEWFSVVLSIFVLAAVLKYRLNVAIVIVVSGVVGAVAQWLA